MARLLSLAQDLWALVMMRRTDRNKRQVGNASTQGKIKREGTDSRRMVHLRVWGMQSECKLADGLVVMAGRLNVV